MIKTGKKTATYWEEDVGILKKEGYKDKDIEKYKAIWLVQKIAGLVSDPYPFKDIEYEKAVELAKEKNLIEELEDGELEPTALGLALAYEALDTFDGMMRAMGYLLGDLIRPRLFRGALVFSVPQEVKKLSLAPTF